MSFADEVNEMLYALYSADNTNLKYEKDNKPLSGANVLGKGTTNGSNTDANGDFRFLIAGGVTGVLVVSFTGYDSKEVTPGIYSNLGTIKLYPSP